MTIFSSRFLSSLSRSLFLSFSLLPLLPFLLSFFLILSNSFADNRDNNISFVTTEGAIDTSTEPFVCNVGLKHPYPVIPGSSDGKICYILNTTTKCTKSDNETNHNCVCSSLSASRSNDYIRYTTKASLTSLSEKLNLVSSQDNVYNVIYPDVLASNLFSVSPITSLNFLFGSDISGLSYFIDVCQPEIVMKAASSSGHQLTTYLADLDITPPSPLKYIPFVGLKAVFSAKCYLRDKPSYVRDIPIKNLSLVSAGHIKISWYQKEYERCVIRYEFKESAYVIREWQLHASSIEIHTKLPDGHCTRTSGYWATHAGAFTPNNTNGNSTNPNNYDSTWDLLSKGPATIFLSSHIAETWYKTLVHSSSGGPRSNGYYILAQQFIATHLNYLAGSPITAVITEYNLAKQLLDEYSSYPASYIPDTDTEEQLKILALKLDVFNNGKIGPGHCD
ncbi:MAG: hypothetical protein HQK51_19810 [Oligoflexia bacterium]|nr:hypothetical protein [Oligoflexia bacterium]